jgi:hypothetical protein
LDRTQEHVILLLLQTVRQEAAAAEEEEEEEEEVLQTKQIGQESKEREKLQQAPVFCAET